MDKSFEYLLVATIFSFLLLMNVQPMAASQLYFPPPGNNGTLSSSSSNASLETPQVSFPTKEEIIAAQNQLGPNIYLRISNASQGSPSHVQGVTVTNTTATNTTATNSTMYVTWIGNETTVFLSIIQGKGPSLEDQIVFPAKPISLNSTMNASNLQITAIPGLTSITWDAIDADTGLRNIYGSLSRDGMNFYSFQISSGFNNAFDPWQPDPHFILYIEIGDPDDVCRGPQPDADAETSTNATTAGNATSQTVNATTNNLGSINGTLPQGPFDGSVCLYRWA
jgi:hypothetical protein